MDAQNLLWQALMPIISEQIKVAIKEAGVNKEFIASKINDAISIFAKNSSKIIEVKISDDEFIKLGLAHNKFEQILNIVGNNINLLITGDAGLGKSHLIQQVATALKLKFHPMSVSSQTTKTDLLGFIDANGIYHHNGFISAFRDGGLFLLDEIDAGNPNVLVVLNSAISNGFLELPNGEFCKKHDDFRLVATANTFGNGSNSKFVGRNKLDFATRDRFVMLNLEVDLHLEFQLIGQDKKLHDAILAMRANAGSIDSFSVTQRSSITLSKLLKMGIEAKEALNIAVFKGLDFDSITRLEKAFFSKYKAVEKVTEKIDYDCPDCGSKVILKDGHRQCEEYPIMCDYKEFEVVNEDPFSN